MEVLQKIEMFGKIVRNDIVSANTAKWLMERMWEAVDKAWKEKEVEYATSKVDIWARVNMQAKRNQYGGYLNIPLLLEPTIFTTLVIPVEEVGKGMENGGEGSVKHHE